MDERLEDSIGTQTPPIASHANPTSRTRPFFASALATVLVLGTLAITAEPAQAGKADPVVKGVIWAAKKVAESEAYTALRTVVIKQANAGKNCSGKSGIANSTPQVCK